MKEFIAWKKKKLMYTPWTKLSVDEIRFLEKVLAANPKARLTIEQICEEQWFKTEIPMPEVSQYCNLARFSSACRSNEKCPKNSPKFGR